jgi:hypothetical protein
MPNKSAAKSKPKIKQEEVTKQAAIVKPPG